MTNNSGTRVSMAEDFYYFDQMPAEYREFLRHSVLNWGAKALVKRYYRYDAAESFPMAKELIQDHERQSCIAVWGREHPNATISKNTA